MGVEHILPSFQLFYSATITKPTLPLCGDSHSLTLQHLSFFPTCLFSFLSLVIVSLFIVVQHLCHPHDKKFDFLAVLCSQVTSKTWPRVSIAILILIHWDFHRKLLKGNGGLNQASTTEDVLKDLLTILARRPNSCLWLPLISFT